MTDGAGPCGGIGGRIHPPCLVVALETALGRRDLWGCSLGAASSPWPVGSTSIFQSPRGSLWVWSKLNEAPHINWDPSCPACWGVGARPQS